MAQKWALNLRHLFMNPPPSCDARGAVAFVFFEVLLADADRFGGNLNQIGIARRWMPITIPSIVGKHLQRLQGIVFG